MQLRRRKTLAHVIGGAAVVATAALAAPALASAEPADLTGPDISTSVDGSTLTVTVANPNEAADSSCGAFALDAAKLPALKEDPSKVTEPGFLTWQTPVADRVGAGAESTFTADLADGIYAVIGECLSVSDPAPVVGDPQIVPVGGLFGSLDFGSLQDLLPGDLGDLGGLLGKLTTGSTQPEA
ncbi:hypothetical protein [Prescottella sp. R16]|uniref:hypothetical protein n=1 Tax=Prescottella sp. R16 TaxID=3064529 RepID=UPI00272EB0C5|nr:hypothetical protein [Prescottella sp. R16]